MIKGIFETHINVSNYQASSQFYEQLPGIIRLHEDPARKSSFYWVGRPGESMLGIRENYPSPLVQRQHFAFRVELEDMLKARTYLDSLGIPSENFHGESSEELIVFPFMPAVSIYFDDPDGHSLELIAMLNDDPRPELGLMTWSEWESLNERERPDYR
ncbi:glyoxalase [Paenibacillus sp. PK3_47]|uniref:VOC family protein n=1 Tax=Paenibacillus sp. PK3_47 TaxID=2072642 RepID=UPI00201D8150|nr:VOC family protein [Paenibacillus sp. PK3_47]UQZ35869.1 glyoxalase [Paenibacillus sp. PK3_47]